MSDGEELSKDQLILAVTLSHVSLALAHLMKCSIRDNADVNAAINLIHPMIRARCDSDEMFDDLMDLAGEQIKRMDTALN
jgi:hypothetical protein